MNYLTYISVWDKLTAGQQEKLTETSKRKTFRKGEILHNGSADCLGLVLVISGQLRAYHNFRGRREITMYPLI